MLKSPSRRRKTDKLRLLRRRRDRPRMTLRQRMPAEKLRKGVYLIPSLFTAGNLMCGFFSIIATFRGEYRQRRVADSFSPTCSMASTVMPRA